MKTLFRYIKITTIGGFIFLIPVIVLVIIINKAIQISLMLAGPVSSLIPVNDVFGLTIINILGFLIIALFSFLAGLIARYTFFSKALQKAESKFLWKVPGYAFIKGFTDSISGSDSTSTMKPVIMSLDDSSQIAFEVEKSEDGKCVIYVPGTPNPWSGSILIVTQNRVEYLPVTMTKAVQTLTMLGKGTKKLMEIQTNVSGLSKDE